MFCVGVSPKIGEYEGGGGSSYVQINAVFHAQNMILLLFLIVSIMLCYSFTQRP